MTDYFLIGLSLALGVAAGFWLWRYSLAIVFALAIFVGSIVLGILIGVALLVRFAFKVAAYPLIWLCQGAYRLGARLR